MRSAGLQSMREFAIRADLSEGKMIERGNGQQLFSRLFDFRSQQPHPHIVFLRISHIFEEVFRWLGNSWQDTRMTSSPPAWGDRSYQSGAVAARCSQGYERVANRYNRLASEQTDRGCNSRYGGFNEGPTKDLCISPTFADFGGLRFFSRQFPRNPSPNRPGLAV
jgi:hypothetical protein